ncbi:MAG: T9SS type A sorting domain-containing protein [Patiriisocius sp.]|uniref:T9SS type A sorting domain-containing protein n=1 Tax=Patiriisocius sp. TaxID=2822396 RepID=UPI003EF82E20
MKINLAFVLTLFFYVSFYSQNSNISEGNVFEGEPYIVIDPADENHIIIAWMGWGGISNRVVIKTKTSFDGGLTWSDTNQLMHADSGYNSADCSIDFDSDGNIYISFIDSDGTGTAQLDGGIYLCKSTDGGLTFEAPIEVLNNNADPERLPIDRPWITIDRSTSSSQGTIYITSMNASNAMPEYHPYVSVSVDGGATFEFKEIDGPGWLSGEVAQPMPTPSISSNGIFNAIYPSFLQSQSVLSQYIIASSANGGNNFTYSQVFQGLPLSSEPLAKKGYILRTNPANQNDMVFVYLSSTNGDFDVMARQTFDAGATWTSEIRVNDDPISNDRMQDLVWADYASSGDLIISWRDRRNADDSGYETQSEIWAAYKPQGSANFEQNFQITDQLVVYDDVLAAAGNDFMSIQLEGEIVHTVWGDPRNGTLNIWYAKLQTDGTILGIQEIVKEEIPEIIMYPNPAEDFVSVDFGNLTYIQIFDSKSTIIYEAEVSEESKTMKLAIDELATGTYFLVCKTISGSITKKLIKQ